MTQSKKDFWVVFDYPNVRIYKDISGLGDSIPRVKNPSLLHVRGVAPHHWKLIGSEVVEMTEEEKIAQLKDAQNWTPSKAEEPAQLPVSSEPISEIVPVPVPQIDIKGDVVTNMLKIRLQQALKKGIIIGVGLCGLIYALKLLLV